MKKERELIVRLENQPGNLAKIAAALAERNVNIRGFLASEEKGRSPVHLLVDKLSDATQALSAVGVETEEREVVTLELDNRPGALAETTDKLGTAGININYAYFSVREGEGRALLVLATADASKAVTALA